MRSECAVGWLVLVGGLVGAGPDRPPATVTAERGARQPQAAIDDDGRIHVVFGVGDLIRHTASADGGRTFAAPTTVGSVESLALGMRRGPRVAATSGAIVVSAIGHRPGDLLSWRSTDGGRTWTGPTRLNAVAGSAREGLHAMAARPDGTVFCAWLDLRNKGTEIFGIRSTDGGATWEDDRPVYRSPDRTVCECCHPSVAFGPDGSLYVMWRNQIRGARDMYLCQSPDGGQNFGPSRKLGRETWLLRACPMDGGAIAAGPSGAVETVWRRADDVYSDRPGDPERHLGRGQQPWAAYGPGGTHTVWLGPGPDRQSDALWVATPNSPQPRLLADHAGSPVVVAAPGDDGPAVALWETAGRLVAARLSTDR